MYFLVEIYSLGDLMPPIHCTVLQKSLEKNYNRPKLTQKAKINGFLTKSVIQKHF